MGRCKDCKYWNNKVIGAYTEQFGFCENGKIKEYDYIKITYNPETKKLFMIILIITM